MSKKQPVPDRNTIHIEGNANVGRDMVLRDQYNLFIQTIGPFTPPPDLDKLRRDYLAHVGRAFRALDFKGIPQLRSLPNELALEDVYVPLMARPELPDGDTWERRLAGRKFDEQELPEGTLQMLERGHSAPPVQIETALREKSRVVVLGDPGSGKSTMLKYLALRLAQEDAAPLPIILPLNAYARALAQHDVNLQSYLAEYYAGRAQGVAALAPLFDDAIADGKAVILLDGLDEAQSDRAALAQKVEAFAHEAAAHGNRVLVTSRIVGYREAALAPKDWSLYTLLDFDPPAIEAFTENRCLAFEKSTLGDTPEARTSAESERLALLDALHANPGVSRLAANPLLLTILALIKRQGVELPKTRIKLYDRYLETLIEAWNRASALDKSAARRSLDYESTLDVLGPLALRLREENPTAGLVSARQLQDWLCDYYTGEQWRLTPGPAREKAREFLEDVRHSSNLLVERGDGQYGFIHLTFEEALAAYGLAAAGQLDPQRSLEIIQNHLTDPAWRETTLLSVGVRGIINRQPQAAGEMARAMLKMDCASEQAAQNVLLAGACLEDVGEAGLGRSAAYDVIAALEATSLNRSLPPATQRDAGFILGRLAGSNPAFLERIRPDLDEWISIPAGEFLYGDDNRKEVIKEPFAIQKYPMTNLQYKRFIDDKGYERREFWSDEGWGWRTGVYDNQASDNLKGWLVGRPMEKRNEPYYWRDKKWNNPLAPVVGINWFEAEAYANWLSKGLDRLVRLPTEQEWERAARGINGREYPWGNIFTGKNLNCAEFWGQDDQLDWDEWRNRKGYEIASATLVGQFPNGATPEGICDLSGNVWEWTNSEDEKDILRSGSWFIHHKYTRCHYRHWATLIVSSNSFGFRLVSRDK